MGGLEWGWGGVGGVSMMMTSGRRGWRCSQNRRQWAIMRGAGKVEVWHVCDRNDSAIGKDEVWEAQITSGEVRVAWAWWKRQRSQGEPVAAWWRCSRGERQEMRLGGGGVTVKLRRWDEDVAEQRAPRLRSADDNGWGRGGMSDGNDGVTRKMSSDNDIGKKSWYYSVVGEMGHQRGWGATEWQCDRANDDKVSNVFSVATHGRIC
jgi:hypothetical protein